MKRVYSILDPRLGTHKLLAEFPGPDAAPIFHDADYQAEVEINGIFTPATGTVHPNNGQAFYDALSKVYSHSTYMKVIEE